MSGSQPDSPAEQDTVDYEEPPVKKGEIASPCASVRRRGNACRAERWGAISFVLAVCPIIPRLEHGQEGL